MRTCVRILVIILLYYILFQTKICYT